MMNTTLRKQPDAGIRTSLYKTSVMMIVSGLALAVMAAEITWKGGGTTTAWSDGSNWEGGIAPTLGDTAIIPSGKTAGLSSADITYISADATKLAGISLPAADATLWVTNTSDASMLVPVSGVGHYLVDNNAKATFHIKASSPDFSGPVTFTNSTVWINWYSINKYPLGQDNVVTLYSDSDKPIVYFGKATTFENEWRIYSTGSVKSTQFTFWENVTFARKFSVDGEWLCNCQSTIVTFKGGFSHTGARQMTVYSTSGYAQFTGSEVCEFKTTSDHGIGGILVSSEGAAFMGSPISADSSRIISCGLPKKGCWRGIVVDCDNLITNPKKTSLQLGGGGDSQGLLDLNGHDLVCADIYKNGNITKAGKLFVTSSVPAKLTMCGSAAWYADYMISSDQYLPLSLDGYASFEINSTNRTTAGWMTFKVTEGAAGVSNTRGSLYAKRGTLKLTDSISWPNLASIEVSGQGKLNLDTANINPNFALVISNVADKAVTVGTDLTAKTMYADEWLQPGVYGGADAGLDEAHTLKQLAGTGKVTVTKYGGKKGLMVIIR